MRGGDYRLTVDPMAQPFRAVFENLSYQEFREMFDTFWDEHGFAIAHKFKIKGKKSKGGKASSAKKIAENNIGLKKLYGDVIVEWFLDKMDNVMFIEGFDLYNFEPDKNPVLVVIYYNVPKVDISDIDKNWELKDPTQGNILEMEWEKYCKSIKSAHATTKDCDEDTEIRDDHHVQVDITATVDGNPYTPASVRMQWINLREYEIAEFVSSIVGKKKGDLFEISYVDADRTVDAQVKIHGVKFINYPELNDDLAKDANFDSLAAMREDFVTKHKKGMEDLKKRMAADHILDKIAQNVRVPLFPQKWLDNAAIRALEDQIKSTEGDRKKAFNSLGAQNEEEALDKLKGHIFQDALQKTLVKSYVDFFDIGLEDSDKIYESMVEHVNWI